MVRCNHTKFNLFLFNLLLSDIQQRKTKFKLNNRLNSYLHEKVGKQQTRSLQL